MYESITVVGERGQITIPKLIREKEGLNAKDRVIVSIVDNKIVVEKFSNEDKEKLMIEFYKKYSKLMEEIEDDWKYAGKEADVTIDG